MRKIRKIVSAHRKKVGLPPGEPVFVGSRKVEKVRIDVIDYTQSGFNEKVDCSITEAVNFAAGESVTWINVIGIHNTDIVTEIGRTLNLHPLTIEDIVNTGQRPKTEEFTGYIFLVMKMMTFNEKIRDIDVEHVSLILGKNYVISFQEREGDVFDPLRKRIRTGAGRVRTSGSDYLAYTLMDSVIDNYFVALEFIGDYIEETEDLILAEAEPEHMKEIYRLKRSVLLLRKAVWPLREELNSLGNSQSVLIHQETDRYIRNLYDHTIQVIDMVETQRDLLAGMHDTYLTVVSNRMNDIMKVLTIIATIFIPLTFIAGVYGMNFHFMPELALKWTYPAVLLIMLLVAMGMIWFFKRKKWF